MKVPFTNKRIPYTTRNDIVELVMRDPKCTVSVRCELAHGFGVIPISPMINHSHPDAAEKRNSGLRSLQAFVYKSGLTPYYISMSAREKGDGVHEWHMAKDYSTPRQASKLKAHHCILGIDVDYYITLKQMSWLARKGNPMIFYTASPREVAGRHKDINYHTTEEGKLRMWVSGGAGGPGAVYESEVWNYNADTIVFDYWWGSAVYSSDKREVDELHSIVFLTCTKIIRLPVLNKKWVVGERLQHRQLLSTKVPGFAVQKFTVPDKDGISVIWVSIARTGTDLACTIPIAAAITCQARSNASKERITLAGITQIISAYIPKQETQLEASGILADYLATGCGFKIPEMRIWYGEAVTQANNYVNVEPDPRCNHFLDTKGVGRNICKPLVTDPATVPALAQPNDVAAIRGRVEQVRNLKTPPACYAKYCREFCDAVLKTGTGEQLDHSVTPWTPEQVEAAQTGPIQKARNKRTAITWLPGVVWNKFKVKSMMKKEPTTAGGDPRNISTLPPEHNYTLSGYDYAIKEMVLKRHGWFVPAQEPKDVAQRLTNFATKYGKLLEADGSRFDGRVSGWMYSNIVRQIYLRAVHIEGKSTLREALDAEINPRAKTATKTPYAPGTGTLSGSATTTTRNTLMSAGIDYCALREQGFTEDEAWERLCAYAGDDIVSVADLDCFMKTTRNFGLVYEAAEKTPADPVVGFLGRRFMHLFNFGTQSIQDPLRQIKKLHLSFAPGNISLQIARYHKAVGLKALDSMNPLVRAWANAILRTTSAEVKAGRRLEVCDVDLPYYQKFFGDGGWPQLDNTEEYQEWFCKISGIPVDQLGFIIQQLNHVQNPADLYNLQPIVIPQDELKREVQFIHDPMVLPAGTQRAIRDRASSVGPRFNGYRSQPVVVAARFRVDTCLAPAATQGQGNGVQPDKTFHASVGGVTSTTKFSESGRNLQNNDPLPARPILRGRSFSGCNRKPSPPPAHRSNSESCHRRRTPVGQDNRTADTPRRERKRVDRAKQSPRTKRKHEPGQQPQASGLSRRITGRSRATAVNDDNSRNCETVAQIKRDGSPGYGLDFTDWVPPSAPFHSRPTAVVEFLC